MLISQQCVFQKELKSENKIQILDENKKLKAALMDIEKRLNGISDSAFEGIVILENGKIIEVNERYALMHGYRRDELIGQPVAGMTSAEFAEKVKQQIALASEEPFKAVALRKDKSVFPCEIRGKEIKYKGKICQVGVVQDITESERVHEKVVNYVQNLERLVKKQTKQLKDSERLTAMGQTAAMVGHDIRNPLQAIIGEMYLAKLELENIDNPKTQEDMLQSIGFIEEQIDYINKIVSDLQDYAKQIKPEFQQIKINEVIEGSLATVEIPKDVNVIVQVDSALGHLMLDPHLLKRVIVNLITNSIQAMPKGGKLTIKAFTQANRAYITIEDTGTGIPDEVKTRIFQPLITTKSKGQGFGLAVAKRFVEVQDGEISY
jgi:PAS domain S-box-containing protein